MKKQKRSVKLVIVIMLASLLNVQRANSMAIRSFVALPIDQHGYVVRFSFEHLTGTDMGTFITSAAYGLAIDKALLIGIPYQVSPNDKDGFGDVSVLYRHTVLQDDFFSGTSRFALLAGAIVPTDSNRDPAVQAGFVYTFFKNRHEFDIDALYQAGIENRPDSGRYDISWQYRLLPTVYPDWGISPEFNVVTELNGRWSEGNEVTHQVTLGLQFVNSRWVIEGGVIKNLNNNEDLSVILSTRFHF
jgi:hypothetical protein